ncbi:hypothetical protein ACFSTC_61660 [Nonomuraea ferruginea]
MLRTVMPEVQSLMARGCRSLAPTSSTAPDSVGRTDEVGLTVVMVRWVPFSATTAPLADNSRA